MKNKRLYISIGIILILATLFAAMYLKASNYETYSYDHSFERIYKVDEDIDGAIYISMDNEATYFDIIQIIDNEILISKIEKENLVGPYNQTSFKYIDGHIYYINTDYKLSDINISEKSISTASETTFVRISTSLNEDPFNIFKEINDNIYVFTVNSSAPIPEELSDDEYAYEYSFIDVNVFNKSLDLIDSKKLLDTSPIGKELYIDCSSSQYIPANDCKKEKTGNILSKYYDLDVYYESDSKVFTLYVGKSTNIIEEVELYPFTKSDWANEEIQPAWYKYATMYSYQFDLDFNYITESAKHIDTEKYYTDFNNLRSDSNGVTYYTREGSTTIIKSSNQRSSTMDILPIIYIEDTPYFQNYEKYPDGIVAFFSGDSDNKIIWYDNNGSIQGERELNNIYNGTLSVDQNGKVFLYDTDKEEFIEIGLN
jgi:hypothetical protein